MKSISERSTVLKETQVQAVSQGGGSNWDTVTGLLKVTAFLRNCIVTGLHF